LANPLPFAAHWRRRLAILLVVGAVGLLLYGWFGIRPNEIWSSAQAWRESASRFNDDHPVLAALAFAGFYVVFTGLSLPGALWLTLLGGAIFGTSRGVVIISFASTAGATIAFLLSRHFLRDWVRAKYGVQFAAMWQELHRGGLYYLMAMRLNPLVPYFLINLFFGLTEMRTWRFWIISQVGMLPATVVYTHAGAQLGTVQRWEDAVSARVGLALILLSLMPLAARAAAAWLLSQRG
jgi:uncharacterized membrane protein YdjX (TVP38/TMEM64 family)